MQQESVDEVMGCERHGADHIALAPISGGKVHLAVTHLDNAVVGNRHPVGGAADIIQYLFGTAKGFFWCPPTPCDAGGL